MIYQQTFLHCLVPGFEHRSPFLLHLPYMHGRIRIDGISLTTTLDTGEYSLPLHSTSESYS